MDQRENFLIKSKKNDLLNDAYIKRITKYGMSVFFDYKVLHKVSEICSIEVLKYVDKNFYLQKNLNQLWEVYLAGY